MNTGPTNKFIKSKRMAKLILVVIFCVSLPLVLFMRGSVQDNATAISVDQEKIIDKARLFAWPEKDKSKSTSPTTAFSEAAKAVGLDADNDCLRFVQVVILSSGVDPSFPKGKYSHNGGVDEYSTVKYMNKSDKWKKISTTNVGSLQAGDILVSAVNGVGNNRIFIYLGNGKAASANQGKWYGRIENLSEEWDPNGNSDKAFYYGNNKYQVFRINPSNTANTTNTNDTITNNTTTNSNTSNSNTSSSKTGQQKGLSEYELNKFSQNNILFYNPGECIESSKSSGICGNTAEEKFWSILRQTLDPLHAAAAFGNIAGEGYFQPVKWEHYKIADPDTGEWMSGITWEDIYNGVYDGKYGVGSFGITTGLSDWLHYVNDNAPDLLQYFQDPSNTLYKYATGDDLAEKIGQDNVDRLIELEANYFIHEWIPKYKGEGIYDEFLGLTDLDAAARYWAHDIEVCAACGYDDGDYLLPVRAAEAQKYYDEYKDFTCTADSSGTVSGKDIIWIGDSNSVTAGEDLLEKTFPGLKNGGWGPSFDDAKSYIQGSKWVDAGGSSNPSGIEILEKIIKEKKLRKYLVFALGDNGGWEKEYIDKIMKLVGNDTKVIFTTNELYCSYHKDYYGSDCKYKINYTTGNEELRKAPERYKNVYIADVAAKYKDEYFDPANTTIEFNSKGAQMFVDTIKSALLSASSGSSSTSTSSTSSSSGSNSSTTDSSTTKVQWKDGWLVEGSIDGLVIEDVTKRTDLSEKNVNPIGSYTTDGGKPNKILLHSTEGNKNGLEAYSADNMYPAHFTIDLKNKTISQHFSIYQPSMAIAKHDLAGPIQFEIVGFSTKDSEGYDSKWALKNFSDEDWDYLAKVLLAISEETGIPLTSSVSWANGAKRLSVEEFANYKGVLGHMHAPDNDHTDPGDIWQYVEKAISRQSGGCGTGEFVWYPQFNPGQQWQGTPWWSEAVTVKENPPINNSSIETTFGDIGCGPFAFAMMANMILPQEITPKDTMKIAVDTDSIGFHGSYGERLTKNLAEHYGLEWEKLDSSSTEASMNDITKHLKEGWMVMTAGGGSVPYTSNGHYVGIRGIEGNNWLIADAGHMEEYSQKTWNPKDIMSAGISIGNVYAFRSTSSTPCNDNNEVNYCSGDNNSSSAGTGTETSKPIESIHEDSTNIPCDPRTKDWKVVDDAYYDGKPYSIRLCSIPNIKMNGSQGDDGSDGYVHVNSRVSGAFYALSEENKKTCGNYLEANDDYRTYAEQSKLYNDYINGNGNLAAAPGSIYANHQGGLAIDFDTSTYCSELTSGGYLSSEFLSKFGLQNATDLGEPWHVDPEGSR